MDESEQQKAEEPVTEVKQESVEHKKHENKDHKKHEHKKAEARKEESKSESKQSKEIKISKLMIWQIATAILAILFIISIFTHGFRSCGDAGVGNVTATANTTTSSGKVSLTVVNDKRCADCASQQDSVVSQLKSVFPNVEVKSLDYSSPEGKALYKSAQLTTLPAFLFDKSVESDSAYSNIQKYVAPAGDYLSLRVGASFDPNKEICNNGIDDTNDGKVDCEDATCKTEWACVEKTDKPKVEMFIMSYCPYGTQIEKGMLPVVKALGNKADIQVKFVNYAMHGDKEVTENLLQYCMQKDYNSKYWGYLGCFLNASDQTGCLKAVGLQDDSKLKGCIADTDKEFKLTEVAKDQSKWGGSRFPPFPVEDADNKKYSVQGSPTLIINGAQPQAGRDSKSLLDAICFAFKNKPAECDSALSSAAPSPGFGFDAAAAGATTAAQCG